MSIRSYLATILLFYISAASLAAQHKIIYMISPPRSLSTAFLRMMGNRGDFKTFNEPSQYAYASSIGYRSRDIVWDRSKAPHDFAQVKNLIFKTASTSHTFAEEISFSVTRFLQENIDFIQNPNVHFVFLCRNPHPTLISLYRKLYSSTFISLYRKLNKTDFFEQYSPSFISQWVGYKSLCDCFNLVKQYAINTPIIIFSEDLYNDTHNTIEAFCNHVGIPFDEKHLRWPAQKIGLQEFVEYKFDQPANEWHGDALKSTGFGKPSDYAVDNDGDPTFEEITNVTDRALWKEAYKESLPYYQLLCNEKEYFLKK